MNEAVVNSHVLRVMAYLAIVTNNGGSLSDSEIDVFASTPIPQPPVRGSVIAAALGSGFKETVIQSGEPVSHFLRRVKWLDGPTDGGYLTKRGNDVLRSLSETERESPDVSFSVIDPKSPFRYADVEQQYRDERNDLLVDPYFRLEELKWALGRASIRRVLTSKSSALTFDSFVHESENPVLFEVRSLPDELLHDRAITRLGGALLLMGQSTNGLGKKLSTFVEVPAFICSEYVQALEKRWSQANVCLLPTPR
jgi:hypothetical protein